MRRVAQPNSQCLLAKVDQNFFIAPGPAASQVATRELLYTTVTRTRLERAPMGGNSRRVRMPAGSP